jgi:large subunit ribosomal protein L10
MEKKGRTTIRPEKLKEVEEIAQLISKYKVVGVLDLYKTPAATMQKIKVMLRGKMVVRAAKNSILIRALEKANKKDLIQYVKGYPCLILTDMDPFKIYNFLQKNKIPASAKAGDVPKKDVEIKAGPTDLMPGPAISTLTKVKIPARVEGGKIGILRDFVALKAGQPLSVDLAAAFQLLKLKPMENGLTVSVLCEGSTTYKGEQLLVDDAKVMADIQKAIMSAFNLSINASYPTKETIGFMLSKAYLNAKELAAETKIEV